MPRTETPTVETITGDLATARTQLQELRRRLVAGDTAVSASDLSAQRSQVEFLELRLEAAAEAEEDQAEKRRQDQLEEALRSISAQRAGEAARLGKLETAAVEAMAKLHAAAVEFVRSNGTAKSELHSIERRLGPLPPSANASERGSVTLDDVAFPDNLDWVGDVLLAVVAEGIAQEQLKPSTPGGGGSSAKTLTDLRHSNRATGHARRIAKQITAR